MDKLISANLLKKNLSTKTKTDSEASRFIDIIDEQPIAYDQEKVLAEMNRVAAAFDCRICPKRKENQKVCDHDCADELIHLLFKIVEHGGEEGTL